MNRHDISRTLGEAQELADMADHAVGVGGNAGLVSNLCAQIERKLGAVSLFIGAAPVGVDLMAVMNRHEALKRRLVSYSSRGA